MTVCADKIIPDLYLKPAQGKVDLWDALLAICSTLALRTPFTVPTINSSFLATTSLSTNSKYVPRRKAASASRLHLGYISMSSSVLFRAGAGPWSLNSSFSFSRSQSQAVFKGMPNAIPGKTHGEI